MSTTEQYPPEHISPRAIYNMTGDELDTLLDGIRERRLSSVRQYEAAQKAAKEAADEKARNALLKQCDMCHNTIVRVDKALASLEERVNKIRALRLELGLD